MKVNKMKIFIWFLITWFIISIIVIWIFLFNSVLGWVAKTSFQKGYNSGTEETISYLVTRLSENCYDEIVIKWKDWKDDVNFPIFTNKCDKDTFQKMINEKFPKQEKVVKEKSILNSEK